MDLIADIDKAKIDKFAQKAQAIDKRIANLYQGISTVPALPNALPQALMELLTASRTLHYAMEELYQQNEQLLEAQNILYTERQIYQELFEEAPDGYLVTDAEGKIQQANCTATRLLNIDKQFLIGKLIISFVHLEERQVFRYFLSQLSQCKKSQELVIRLQRSSGELFYASLIVAVVSNQQGEPPTLRFLVRNVTQQKQTELALTKYDFSSDRPTHKYAKGEMIPLEKNIIWYVCQGVVKLTTVCESSEEVLVGLAVPKMIFGSNMTSLDTYQATALSKVSVVAITVSEIATSPALSHAILPMINQRLRQTESFLVILGYRRIKDRLYKILQLLKKEIGEPVAQGTRLSVRLTHEDLASACSTSRVTITRLMHELKQQGKICMDAKRHIILRD